MLPRRVPGTANLLALSVLGALVLGSCGTGPADDEGALAAPTTQAAPREVGTPDSAAGPAPESRTSRAEPSPSAPGTFVPGPADFTAVQKMLERRARSVISRDRAAFERTIDDRDPGLLAGQHNLFDNLAQLRLTSFSYEITRAPLVPDTVPGRAPGEPVLRVRTIERVGLDGALDSALGNETRMTFVRRGGRWVVGREIRPPRPVEGVAPPRPWFGMPVVAARRGDLVVLADAVEVGLVDKLADMALAAVDADAQLLGVPARRNLLIDATSNGRAVRLSAGDPGEAAALYSDVYDVDARGRPTRRAGGAIRVNPDLSAADVADDPGLLRHELSHFLLREYTATAPLWASEGIAEHARWNPLTLADLRVPPSMWRRLQAARGRLPADGTFWREPSMNYLVAQAAVQHLLSLGGMQKFRTLLELYRTRADIGATVEQRTEMLLPEVYQITRRQLASAAWQNLRTLDR